ncbi:hypothetical protein Tco_1461859 [Tanacetum coccineum]
MERITINKYEIESEVLDLLKIGLGLFTCDTPLGIIFDEFRRISSMEDDLFTHELGVVEDFYFPCVEQQCDDLENGNLEIYEPQQRYDDYERMFAEAVILIDNRLVKLIDITLEKWSYRKQFEEYMEIKRRLELDGINTDIRGDDEEILTDDELSNLEEEKIYWNSKRMKIIRMHGLMNGIKKSYGLRKNHGWIMELGRNLMMIYVIIASRFNSKVDTFNGLLWYEGLEDGNLKNEALKEKAILEGSWDMKIEREIKFSHG